MVECFVFLRPLGLRLGTFNDSLIFNSDSHKVIDKNKALALTQNGVDKGKSDEEIKQTVEHNAYYYPPVDVEIVAGDGINKSKAFTLQAITELVKTAITPLNKEIVKAQIDLLDLPQKKEIKESIDQALQPQGPQEDKPSLSIRFSDLPVIGQIQAAAKAGIELTPQSRIVAMSFCEPRSW